MGNFDLKEVELDNILEALKKSLENTEFQPLSDLLKVRVVWHCSLVLWPTEDAMMHISLLIKTEINDYGFTL